MLLKNMPASAVRSTGKTAYEKQGFHPSYPSLDYILALSRSRSKRDSTGQTPSDQTS